MRGPDGRRRCFWSISTADYMDYHDFEWGVAVRDDRGIFERLSLEAFQSGLSWLTILRKRAAFRRAFADFEPTKVAAFNARDIKRLLADSGIVRNRAKIEATIANARATASMPIGLAEFAWSFAPAGRRRAPRTRSDISASTPESAALAKALKSAGFRFVGPTTAYALMQACGLVDDHLVGCWRRGADRPSATNAL
ncbi:MAG: DNA-3-methyladenine glycosylase I [Actinomycetes bacterium]